jgi:hypothetical protein
MEERKRAGRLSNPRAAAGLVGALCGRVVLGCREGAGPAPRNSGSSSSPGERAARPSVAAGLRDPAQVPRGRTMETIDGSDAAPTLRPRNSEGTSGSGAVRM